MVRRGTSATPSCASGEPEEEPEPLQLPAAAAAAMGLASDIAAAQAQEAEPPAGPFATETEGESRRGRALHLACGLQTGGPWPQPCKPPVSHTLASTTATRPSPLLPQAARLPGCASRGGRPAGPRAGPLQGELL